MDDRPGSVRLAPGVWIQAADLTWEATRSGGPGGQGVNTTSSRCQLRLHVGAIVGLTPAARVRLAHLAGTRLTAAGELIIASEETRSLHRNRDLALERLCELVIDAKAVPPPRRPTKPSRGAVRRRLEGKARRAETKRERRLDERA